MIGTVIAGSRREFEDYLRRTGQKPRDFIYAGTNESLAGVRGEVLLVGQWERSQAINFAREQEREGRIWLQEDRR
jgi:hypothetical protein